VKGRVAKRYAEQAMKLEVVQLYVAISLLTATDTGFRTATNQRLFVELALLRLAGLGQKKNVDDYLLPDAIDRNQSFVLDNPKIEVERVKAESPVEKRPAEVRPVESTKESNSQPAEKSSIHNVAAARPSGFSIRELMNTPTDDLVRMRNAEQKKKEEEIASESDVEIETDELPEDIESRVFEASQTLSESLMATRPRLGAVLQRVMVSGKTLNVKVPNEQLREEILFNKQELQRMFIKTLGLRILVDFNIEVEIDNSFIKPVKIEEKVKYFSEMNPQFVELCKRLKIDVE
jgi:DNA polymerase-3 subunit gamma/tau